jgi:hypothetical protein
MKTTSETVFESFLTENNLSFERIEEQDSPRPDYLVHIAGLKLLCEVKELGEDDNFGVVKDPSTPFLKHYSRTLGDHIRSKIGAARKQIQFGADQGIPSVLLVYNNIDPLYMSGTEDMDFIAAMYGEYTLLLDTKTLTTIDSFQGRNCMMAGWKDTSSAERKNTSFGAVGRLYTIRGKLTVTLFDNVFAKVKIPYDALPPCFEVKPIEITYSEHGYPRGGS